MVLIRRTPLVHHHRIPPWTATCRSCLARRNPPRTLFHLQPETFTRREVRPFRPPMASSPRIESLPSVRPQRQEVASIIPSTRSAGAHIHRVQIKGRGRAKGKAQGQLSGMAMSSAEVKRRRTRCRYVQSHLNPTFWSTRESRQR